MSDARPAKTPMNTVAWLICIIASIGFAFDIYELLMLPLILGPALQDLKGITSGSDEFKFYLQLMFYIPAFAGGIFGLFGGYLTDRLGRRRVLTWSILIYACSAFLAGFSTNVWMLLFLRSTTFIGVCVEFVAAVAWLAELFPNPEQREKVIGYTQAFSSIGGLLVAVANGFLIEYGAKFPAIAVPAFLVPVIGQIGEAGQHAAWRYTLMSGLIPALPLILIRPFLPESPVWAQKREAGTLRRPSIGEIFAPQLRGTTIAATIGFTCTLAAAFGAIQQMPQIVPGLADVKAKATAAADKAVADLKAKGETNEKKIEIAGKQARGRAGQKIAAEYAKMQEVGGLLGRFLIAVMLVTAVKWRSVLRRFIVPGMFILPLVFWFFLKVDNKEFLEINLEWAFLGKVPVTTMSLGMFAIGLFTVAQLSFWGNYLPHVYPVHLRGTGESFAANIGGRLIGTSAAALTGFVAGKLAYDGSPFADGPAQFAAAAAVVGGIAYVIGLINSFFLTEPHQAAVKD
jgi:MFS family permease